MPGRSPSQQPSRHRDPTRPHAFLVKAPADQYQYDISKELPECPDAPPNGDWQLQGRFWEGRFREGRLVDHRIRRYDDRRALQAVTTRLREAEPKLAGMHYGELHKVKLREAETMDWWSYGVSNVPPFGGGLTTPYIPLMPGPATRQMYWADYFAQNAKSFEAFHHNPLAHRSIEIATEFVIGRGVQAVAKTDAGQKAWDAFAGRNKMDERLEEILGDAFAYGELFLRYFEVEPDPEYGCPLVVRSLDPAGIYEIITDQEDRETVYFYHQQEQERAQLFAPPAGNQAPTGPTDAGAVTRYTIRQIPPEEIDHYRLNVRSQEVRGRSDLFPALGYLKRLQDLLTSKVIRSDMEARMVFDLMVKGHGGDVASVRNELFPGGKTPEAGTVIGHNDQVELNAFQFTSADKGSDSSVEELVEMCCLGTGVSRQWLWTAAHGGSARAGALVATEPGQKRFERRQRMAQRLLQDQARRVFAANKLTGEDAEIEFIFPSIAVEERSAALKDIAFAESMDWISKETAASMGARQLDIETFDWENEQDKIAEEFANAQEDEGDGEDAVEPEIDPATGAVKTPGKPAKPATPKQGDGEIRRPMVNAQYRQVPKLDPTRSSTQEDQPPGLLMGAEGAPEGAAPGAPPGPRAPGRSGIPGDENPATQAGKANIRQDSGGGAKPVRESDPTLVEIVTIALREAGRAAARIPRRHPDDPEYVDAAESYRTQSVRNVRRLARAIHPGRNGDGEH